MPDPVYDTHGFVKRLNEAGMPEQQAEVLASENMQIMTQVLVTKDDLRALETTMMRQFADLRAEVAEFRAELKADVAELRAEMAELHAEMKADSAELRAELMTELSKTNANLAAYRAEMSAALAADRAETQGEIASIRVQLANLQNRVDTLESRLLIRLGGLVIAVQAAALVIGKLF